MRRSLVAPLTFFVLAMVLVYHSIPAHGALLDDAWQKYTGSCTCGKSYGSAGGNCAHYVSNALIKAGLKGIDGGKGGDMREEHGMIVCPHGRPIRARELKDYFKKHGKKHDSLPANKVTLVYQRRPSDGQDHVVLRKGSAYRGTGNYPSWSVQEYYTLD